MNIDEFEQGLDRYGGDLTRWPEALRDAAATLMAQDLAAAGSARTAARLDRALEGAVAPLPLGAAFVGGVLGRLAGRRPHDAVVLPTRRLAAWAGAAVAVFLVAGYAIGATLPTTLTTQNDDSLASLFFGDGSTTTDGAGSGGLGGLL